MIQTIAPAAGVSWGLNSEQQSGFSFIKDFEYIVKIRDSARKNISTHCRNFIAMYCDIRKICRQEKAGYLLLLKRNIPHIESMS